MTEPTVLIVFLAALITALATGLGALPFAIWRTMSRRSMALANAAAGGLMLAACHALIAEGLALNAGRLILGILLGLSGILIARRLIGGHDGLEIASLKGLDARRAFLIIAVMTAHSFAEGVGVGVAYGDATNSGLGTFITAAIAIHNIPEGLAISLVLVPRGTPVWQAALWSIVSSLPQPIAAVPAFLAVSIFAPLLPIGLGIAAGAMLWMVFAELLPEANEGATPNAIGIAVTLALAAMLAFQVYVIGGH